MEKVCLIVYAQISENILKDDFASWRITFRQMQIVNIEPWIRVVCTCKKSAQGINHCGLPNVVRTHDDVEARPKFQINATQATEVVNR